MKPDSMIPVTPDFGADDADRGVLHLAPVHQVGEHAADYGDRPGSGELQEGVDAVRGLDDPGAAARLVRDVEPVGGGGVVAGGRPVVEPAAVQDQIAKAAVRHHLLHLSRSTNCRGWAGSAHGGWRAPWWPPPPGAGAPHSRRTACPAGRECGARRTPARSREWRRACRTRWRHRAALRRDRSRRRRSRDSRTAARAAAAASARGP